MKGRQILIEPLAEGGHAAALLVDGRIEDLLIDPPDSDATPRPEAIHRAVVGRPMKGTGGVIVDIGGGQSGFLRTRRPPPPGERLLVQVSGWAEPGKAPPLSDRLLFKGRAAILSPGAPGINIARGLRDAERRAELSDVAREAMAGAPPDQGLILRSAAAWLKDVEITEEIATLRAECARVLGDADTGSPVCLCAGPGAAREALREWRSVAGESVEQSASALTERGLWEDIAGLRQPLVRLGGGFLAIEPTRALTAVDVNTGGDLSPAAALKANFAAARELPRQLRLRGLGGQVTVDFAPLAKSARIQVERALASALSGDGIETTIVGWTPLGHLEMLRKRARRPLAH